MNVEEILRTIVTEELGIEEVNPDTPLLNASALDSNEIVETIMRIEEEFELDISEDDAENLVTFKDVVEYIKEKKESKEEKNV